VRSDRHAPLAQDRDRQDDHQEDDDANRDVHTLKVPIAPVRETDCDISPVFGNLVFPGVSV
jgi:hypothetical protein